jgi:hypothetical protein
LQKQRPYLYFLNSGIPTRPSFYARRNNVQNRKPLAVVAPQRVETTSEVAGRGATKRRVFSVVREETTKDFEPRP